MGLNRFVYDTITRDGILAPYTGADYHPSFPVERLRNIWTSHYYRTKYGTDSGWGNWNISATYNLLYFDDTGAVARTATITVGNYDADELCAEIETQMEAQTTDTFTVTYSNTSGKFTITNDTGTFELTCTLTTTAIWEHIGFDTSSDKTGAAAYNSDYMRIHNAAGFVIESGDGSAISCNACALFGLNVTSSYQVLKLQRWTGSAWSDIGDFEYDSDNGRAIITWSANSSIKYRVVARDWLNTDRYFQCGAPVLGSYAEISRGYEYGASFPIDDTSVHQYSKGGFLNVQVGFIKRGRSVEYLVMSADEILLETLYYTYGKQQPMVFVQDADDPENTMEYIIFTGPFNRREEDAYFKSIGLTWLEVN